MLIEKIVQAQLIDNEAEKLREKKRNGKELELTCDDARILRFGRRIFVPNLGELRK